jgi:hypothetical protein
MNAEDQKNKDLIMGNNKNQRNKPKKIITDKEDISNNLLGNNNENNKLHNFLESNNNDYNSNEKDTENYINQIKKVYNKSPKLNIEILNSYIIPRGFIIQIDPLGMISNSLRNVRDGTVYFGFFSPEDENSKDENNNNNQIDFLIKPKDGNYESRFVGKHFQIKFNPNDLKYYIKDLGFGYGTFAKLMKETLIKDNYLINIGNSYIVCSYGIDDKEKDDDKNILNIKIFDNTKRNPFFCKPKENKKYLIGRDVKCDIIIDDSLLSRIHCTIYYDNEKEMWFIHDGTMKKNKEGEFKYSTNGTWLFLIDDTLIENDMIFKANQNLYQCKYE